MLMNYTFCSLRIRQMITVTVIDKPIELGGIRYLCVYVK